MASTDLINVGGAVVSDVLSALAVPGASTLSLALQEGVKRKRAANAELLIKEITNGHHGPIDFDAADVDPLIDITLRLGKAVSEGAGRENLKLLAQIVAGLKRGKVLYPDKFRRWCNALENLTRDELNVVGMAIDIRQKIVAAGPGKPNDWWQQLQNGLEELHYSKAEIGALCASLTRTGLIQTSSAFSGIAYMDTPWLAELGNLTNFESAMRPEPPPA